MKLEEAELELFAACVRMGLSNDSALYVMLKEYTRLKSLEKGSEWRAPARLD